MTLSSVPDSCRCVAKECLLSRARDKRHYADPRIIPNGWGFGFPVSCRAVADAG